MFKPLWNRKIDGFGNHDPGKGRARQQKSLWDTLHPRRTWAEKLVPTNADENALLEDVEAYIVKARKHIAHRLRSK